MPTTRFRYSHSILPRSASHQRQLRLAVNEIYRQSRSAMSLPIPVSKMILTLILVANLILASNASPSSIKLPCPVNETLTLISFPYSNLVFQKRPQEEVHTLDDLDGFSVDLFKAFLQSCPMNVSISHQEYKNVFGRQTELINAFKNDSSKNYASLLLDTIREDEMASLNFSLPGGTIPISIVYKTNTESDSSSHLIYNYAALYSVLLSFGTVLLFIIVKLETDGSPTPYSELFWNFLVTPFGLAGSVLTETFSRKCFLFFWILSWFLVLSFFSAHFSSSLTVSRLRSSINNVHDILRDERRFFWNTVIMQCPHEKLSQLNRVYKGFSAGNRKYKEYENALDGRDKAEMAAEFLRQHHVLLTTPIQLVVFLEDLKKEMEGEKLILKDDWSVQIPLLFKFLTKNSDLITSFNIFVHRKKTDGSIVKLADKWFSIDKASFMGSIETDSIHTKLMTLVRAEAFPIILAFFGSVLAVLFAAYQFCVKRFRRMNAVTSVK